MDKASYESHPCDEIEPPPDAPNDYRQAALYHLQLLYAVDRYMETAPDARLAIIAISITLGWPSTRGLTVPEIAGQLGVSAATITRACARFREMSGLGSVADGVRFIRPGAGSNADKPVAVQSVGNIPQEPGPIAW
jgi:hypothetical protein